MFIAALFIIATTWNNLNAHRQMSGKIKCGVYIHTYTMEYYSAIKKNEVMPFIATWMNLEITTLSKVSQTEKDKCPMISLICGI